MKIITATQAAQLVKSGDGVMISGSGGGHCIPESILAGIEQRFLDEARAASDQAVEKEPASAVYRERNRRLKQLP